MMRIELKLGMRDAVEVLSAAIKEPLPRAYYKFTDAVAAFMRVELDFAEAMGYPVPETLQVVFELDYDDVAEILQVLDEHEQQEKLLPAWGFALLSGVVANLVADAMTVLAVDNCTGC